MNASERLIVSAQFHRQTADLISETIPLHRQLLNCHQEWLTVLNDQGSVIEVSHIRELDDRIFGFQIELECLHLRMNRAREAYLQGLTQPCKN